MKILFIADELASFTLYKDTTYAMMKKFQQRGHQIFSCLVEQLIWSNATKVAAWVQQLELTPDTQQWYNILNQQQTALNEFDAVIMRKDPPFDSEYFYACHILQQAEREGALVINRPVALYSQPEKLSLLEFAQFAPPTLVTRQASAIRQFYAQHKDIILKPLDGMGGMGIFRVDKSGLNLGAIIETLNNAGKNSVMVQKFLPEIAQGDKRVLIIGGAVIPYTLARIPQQGEVRGNLAAGGKGVAMPITRTEQQVASALAETLFKRGLYLIGLDMIGGKITEINVTSPTCFQEITNQTGYDVAQCFVQSVEKAVIAKL